MLLFARGLLYILRRSHRRYRSSVLLARASSRPQNFDYAQDDALTVGRCTNSEVCRFARQMEPFRRQGKTSSTSPLAKLAQDDTLIRRNVTYHLLCKSRPFAIRDESRRAHEPALLIRRAVARHLPRWGRQKTHQLCGDRPPGRFV